jgi:hypothetical protein
MKWRERRWYKLLPDHTIEPLPGETFHDQVLAWAEWYGKHRDLHVADDKISGTRVSTVFLGHDERHFGDGPPLVFETMLFNRRGAHSYARYSTWDEALAGHRAALAELRAGSANTLAPQDPAPHRRLT